MGEAHRGAAVRGCGAVEAANGGLLQSREGLGVGGWAASRARLSRGQRQFNGGETVMTMTLTNGAERVIFSSE